TVRFACTARCKKSAIPARKSGPFMGLAGVSPGGAPDDPWQGSWKKRKSLLRLRLFAQARGLLSQARFLFAHFRSERIAEIFCFENGADFHRFARIERRALQPFDRLVHRLHLPQP